MFVLLLYGCETGGSRIVEYRYVAYSWTGGNIDEMIEAWGTPKAHYSRATATKPGSARWRVFSKVSGGDGSGGYRYFCDTIATFDAEGMITNIDIRRSEACHRYYKDLGSMLRPGIKPPPPYGN